MKRILSLASVLAALVVAAPSFASPDGDAPAGAGRHARGLRDGGGRFFRHRRGAMRILRSLDLTEAQKAALRESRDGSAALREDLRAKIRAIREDARKGERTPETRKAAREQIRAAITSARTAVQPSAARFVATLSADQKAKAVGRDGKALDDTQLTNVVEKLLLSRGHEGRANAK